MSIAVQSWGGRRGKGDHTTASLFSKTKIHELLFLSLLMVGSNRFYNYGSVFSLPCRDDCCFVVAIAGGGGEAIPCNDLTHACRKLEEWRKAKYCGNRTTVLVP